MMRPTFERGLVKRSMGHVDMHDAYYKQLEEYNFRYQEPCYREMYNERTEVCARGHNQSYEMRSPSGLYKLNVTGLHFDTTKSGLMQILSNYGNPISVSIFRDKNQLVAFVEFESKYEADNVIVGLDGKPPLYWDVSYTFSHHPNDELPHHYYYQDQRFANPIVKPRSQTHVFPVSDSCLQSSHSRQYSRFIDIDRNDSLGAVPRKNEIKGNYSSLAVISSNNSMPILSEFPACFVCGKHGEFICTVCQTRYCSSLCQSRDWPAHQLVCKPLPALAPAEVVLLNGIDARVSREDPNIPFHGLQNVSTSVAMQKSRRASSEELASQYQTYDSAELHNADSNVIKGIHPIDKKEDSNQQVSAVTHQNLENGSKSKVSSSEEGIIPMHLEEIPDISSGRQYEKPPSGGGLPAVSNPRNFLLGSDCLETPDSSPGRTSQTQSTDALKPYAKKFYSGRLKQPLDKCNQVFVCSAKSPSEFFIQYYCYRDTLEEVMEKVKMSVPNADPLTNPMEGQPCIAIFPDDRSWYRAQIEKILPDGIGMRYVDFGNTILMPNSPEHVRMMEYHLSEFPFCAIKAKLIHALPLNGSSWSSEVKKNFKELVENRFFSMEFVQMDADVMCVRLMDDKKADLLTHLMTKNLVGKTTVEVSDELDRIPYVEEVIVQSSANENVEKPPISGLPLPNENVATESTQVLTKASEINDSVINRMGNNATGKSKISSLLSILASSKRLVPKKPNEILEQPCGSVSNIPAYSPVEAESSCPNLNKDEETCDNTSRKFFYSEGPFLDLPENGSFQAFVIKVISPQAIYMHANNEEISTKLAKLKEALAAYANDVSGGYCPQEQEVCVVRFPDGQWYRAFCASLDGTRYICQQVDYGDKHIADASDIRCITKFLVDLVPYVVQTAILQGAESMEESNPKLVDRLQEILHDNTEIDVVVVGRQDLFYIVEIPMVSSTLSFEGLI